MTDIGFLGLGSMGSAMVRRLLEQGHHVTVWNRSSDAVDALVELGAERAETAADAVAVGLSISMLANDDAAEQVLDEATFAAGRGGLHINMASVSPTSADRLATRAAEAGVAYVACPVLGRPPVAEAGRLNILAAGADGDLDRATPALESLGARVWRLGETPRVANVVKIAVNYQIIHALQAIGESVAMVERHGVDAADFTELLSSTLFGGVVYSGYGDMIAHRRYAPPGFTVGLGLKDLGLAEDVAAEVGVELGAAPVLRDAFERTLTDDELGELDWAAIAEITRRGGAG